MSERPAALDQWIAEGLLTEGQYDTLWNAKSGRLDNPDLDNLLTWLLPTVAMNVLAQVADSFTRAENAAAAAGSMIEEVVNAEVARQARETAIGIEIDMERYDI